MRIKATHLATVFAYTSIIWIRSLGIISAQYNIAVPFSIRLSAQLMKQQSLKDERVYWHP